MSHSALVTILIIFILCSIYRSTHSLSNHETLQNHSISSSSFEQFFDSINHIAHNSDTRLNQLADSIEHISGQLNQSTSDCYRIIVSAFRTGLLAEWSAKLIHSNSFAKGDFVSSLISDEYSSLGDYQNCLSISSAKLEDQSGPLGFDGKYCLASLKTPQFAYSASQPVIQNGNVSNYWQALAQGWLTKRNRFSFIHGLCVPSVCTTEQLTLLTQKYFKEYIQGINVTIDHCQQQHSNPTENTQTSFPFIASIFILSALASASLFGTAVFILIESHYLSPHYLVKDVAKCFHIQNNFKSLFSVNAYSRHQHEVNLRFIYGLKAWMIMIIVFVHSFCFMSNLLFSNVSLFSKYPSFYLGFMHQGVFWYNIIKRGFVLIDFFFIISGFLVTHLIIGKFHKVPNFCLYLFSRWFRFAPAIAAILCLTIIIQKLGSGPLFHEELTDPYVRPCHEYWWTHMLFISNFWTIDKICGPNLWFVSVDFQLHLMLYGIMWLYFRKQLYAYASSVALILTSFATFAILVAVGSVGIPRGDYPMQFDYAAPLAAIRVFYTSPLLHIFSYLTGVFLALRLVKAKRKPEPSPYHYQDLLLLLCAGIIAFGILVPFPQALQGDGNENFNLLYFLLFTAAYLLVIVTAVIGLYLLIQANKSSLFKQLFSARFTLPLGRLSYGIYLVNPMLIWYNAQQYPIPPSITILFIAQFFFAIYMQSIILSIILYVFFEAPFHNLSRLLMKRMNTKRGHGRGHGNRDRVSSVLTDSNEMSDYANGNASPMSK